MNKSSAMLEEARRAAEVCRCGGVIIYPTDTVWGIGCDATNPHAVERVFEIKRRRDHRAMLVLVESIERLRKHVGDIPTKAMTLIADKERPTTVVYDNGQGLASGLLGPDGSIGIRLTSEGFTSALCEELGHPIVSTSANISGQPAAHTFPEISQELLDAADYVVDYRRDDLTEHLPSRVVRLHADGTTQILRP